LDPQVQYQPASNARLYDGIQKQQAGAIYYDASVRLHSARPVHVKTAAEESLFP
jgi:hypothetical protein